MKAKLPCLVLLLAVSVSAAQAECPKWEKLRDSGQKAIDDENYKRAEQIWLRAVKEAKNCGVTEPTAVAVSLKRLGEVYMKNAKYPLAETTLNQAVDEFKNAAQDDSELVSDLSELKKNYRTVDFLSGVKPEVADLFKEAGVKTVAILKLAQDQGNRIMVNLSNKFTKKIDNPDVHRLALDKLVSFDIVQEPDGALSISKIKGFKVQAQVWASIIQSHVKPNGPDPSAEVTASALGISKTVNSKLPSDALGPINTFIAKLNEFTRGTPAEAATLHNGGTTSGVTTAVTTTSTTSTQTPAPTSTTSVTSTSTTSPPVASTTSVTKTSTTSSEIVAPTSTTSTTTITPSATSSTTDETTKSSSTATTSTATTTQTDSNSATSTSTTETTPAHSESTVSTETSESKMNQESASP